MKTESIYKSIFSPKNFPSLAPSSSLFLLSNSNPKINLTSFFLFIHVSLLFLPYPWWCPPLVLESCFFPFSLFLVSSSQSQLETKTTYILPTSARHLWVFFSKYPPSCYLSPPSLPARLLHATTKSVLISSQPPVPPTSNLAIYLCEISCLSRGFILFGLLSQISSTSALSSFLYSILCLSPLL